MKTVAKNKLTLEGLSTYNAIPSFFLFMYTLLLAFNLHVHEMQLMERSVDVFYLKRTPYFYSTN